MGDAILAMVIILGGFAVAMRYRVPILRFLKNDGVSPTANYREKRIKLLKRSLEDDAEELAELEEKEPGNIPL